MIDFFIFNGLTADRNYELQDGLLKSIFPQFYTGEERWRGYNCAELGDGDGEARQEKLRLSVEGIRCTSCALNTSKLIIHHL